VHESSLFTFNVPRNAQLVFSNSGRGVLPSCHLLTTSPPQQMVKTLQHIFKQAASFPTGVHRGDTGETNSAGVPPTGFAQPSPRPHGDPDTSPRGSGLLSSSIVRAGSPQGLPLRAVTIGVCVPTDCPPTAVPTLLRPGPAPPTRAVAVAKPAEG